MIDFQYMDIDDSIKKRLEPYKVDFAFQPIYFKNGSLFGQEALMRPEGMSISQYIEEAVKRKDLHNLELLSFFGATLAFGLRGYTGKLCINSLPTECLTAKEYNSYWSCFEHIRKQLVVEMVEYSDYKSWTKRVKEAQLKSKEGILLSIDDFGTGNNDITRVKTMSPNIVKVDRSLISNIHIISSIQRMVDQFVYTFHEMGIMVLAEGIETKEEYEYLQTTDIDLYQGYYLGKPN